MLAPLTMYRPFKSRRGFALIVALALMGFILLIMLSLSLLVKVESFSAYHERSLFVARENAMLGALIALGELQRTMGPDMRISAQADILSTESPDNPDVGVDPFDAAEAARFWTGVWDSEDWNPGSATDRQGRFERWLVSLPVGTEAAIDTVNRASLPINLNDDAQAVTLAQIRAVPQSGGDPVLTDIRAPLYKINDSGSFAWWISDEGVKANPALVDPYLGESENNLINDIPRFFYPHRNNLRATDWFANTDFNDENLVAKLQKVTGTPESSSLAFVNANLTNEAQAAFTEDSLMADYTFYSHGVLSSNRRGGLRKDLSLAFWRDPDEMIRFEPNTPSENPAFENDFRRRRIFNYQDYPQSEQSVRSPSSASSNFFAPRWEVLRDYHNSFQKIANSDAANAQVYPVLGSDGNRYLHIYRSSDGSGGTIAFEQATGDHLHNFAPSDATAEILVNNVQPVEPTTSPVTPILLRMNIEFELAMVEKVDSSGLPVTDGDGNQIYHPQMRLNPTVTLWNPYNVAISYEALDGTFVDAGFLQLNTQTSGRLNVDFDIDGKPFSLVDTDNRTGLTGSNNILEMEFNPTNPALNYFAPGEVRVLTVETTTTADNANMNNEIQLSSVFPVDEAYLTITEALRGIEKLEGETLEVITSVSDTGDGMRPMLQPGSGVNSNYTHRFRINMAAPFGPEETSLTVNDVDTVILGSLELHLQPGSQFAIPDYNTRRFANFNVRPIFPKGGLMNTYSGQIPNYWLGFLPGPAEVDYQKIGVETDAGTLQRGFWGASAGAADGSSFLAFFDVPRRPPESLGQYQHAHLANLYPHMPTYPLGNSIADPHVSRPYAIDYSGGRTFMDISWFLNDSLWDDYFLSTIDPYDIDGLNPDRLSPLRDRFVELDETVEYNPEDPNDYQDVAANLLLRGAFNVNSTSVEAWAALLSGLGGEGINYIDPASETTSTTGDLEYPIHRNTTPIGDRNTPWTGAPRDFDRSEIRTLAENIVKEVKKRGPFLSLSDFINRRLTDDDRGLKGAIQAAIDADNFDAIRSVVPDNGTVSLAGSPAGNNIEAKAKPSDFAPGYLTQADVLTTIGPSLSARSDTFIIRSYGNSTNPLSQKIEGEAWCEMLVQRIPEEVTPNSKERAFRVLSFRFLNADEI